MKKHTKLLALLTACALCTGIFALVGCGEADSGIENGGNGGDATVDDGGSTEEVTTSYQFLGSYDELVSSYANFELLANMLSDGTGTIYLSTETSSDLTVSEIAVSEWTCEEDRDGIVTFTFVAVGTTYTAYQESDGTFEFEYTFSFAGSYHRTAKITGSSTITYATVDEWETAITGRYAELNSGSSDEGGEEDNEKEVSYTFTSDSVNLVSTDEALATYGMNMTAEVVLYADGTVEGNDGLLSAGYAFVTESGTWTANDDGTITIVLNDTTYTATYENGAYTFTWNVTHDEGAAYAVLSCTTDEITGGGEEAQASYTFTADTVNLVSTDEALSTYGVNMTAEVILYSDGTAEGKDGLLSYGYAFVNESGTWTANDDGTITIVLNDTTYTATYENGAYTFTWNVTHDEGAAYAVLTCSVA